MTSTTLLATGIRFGEGPRWHDGRLWFSDFYDHAVKSVDSDGNVAIEVQLAGDQQPSGLGWLPDGRLLIVSMLERRLLRREGADLVEHADLSSVASFHCNDMVVDSTGRAYVGNFGFDLEEAFRTRGVADTFANHATAAVARVDPDGSVHLAADGLDFPNGTVITPDGRTMIIAETLGGRLTAFDIADDGTLHDRRVWATLPRAAPDGICLDAELHVWVANPSRSECILVAEGGEIVQHIATDLPSYACMLGGEDGRTLFMLTARTSAAPRPGEQSGAIVTARVSTPAAGLP